LFHVIQRLADVLASNKSMLKVYEKGDYPVEVKLVGGLYALTITFNPPEK